MIWLTFAGYLKSGFEWSKKNPKFLLVVALLIAGWWLRHDAAKDATLKCEAKEIVREVKIIKEVANVRSKAAIASSKRDLPDELLRFYVD